MTKQQDTLPPNLQTQILSLLLYDDENGKFARNALPIEAWGTDVSYLLLIKKIYEYIDTYKKAPDDMVNTLIEELIISKDRQQLLEGVIKNCRTIYNDGMNVEYVIDSLHKFYRQSSLQTATLKCMNLLNAGRLDEAEEIFYSAAKQKITPFDTGTTLLKGAEELFSEKNQELDQILLNIKALDRRNLNPQRKELFLFVAAPKRGKSWFLINAAKQAMNQNKKVVHISLEMSEKIVARRYLQSIFGTTSGNTDTNAPMISFSENGDFNLKVSDEKPPTLQAESKNIIDSLSNEGAYTCMNRNLRIKQFPTGGLSLPQLNAYLDSLEMKDNWIPDVLVVDYADLMKVRGNGSNDYRIELGQIYKELRGLAVERNLILITASQANRGGADKERIDDTDIAEDYSKVATADTVITYTQKETEKALGLARLYVANSRNAEDRFDILISQHYNTGQFALDSCDFTHETKDKYDKTLKELSNQC